jgi:hypothetical protein
MRFFDTTKKSLAISEIDGALKEVDPKYRLDIPGKAKIPQADLYHGDNLCGELEINKPGDGLFDDEIEEMLEFLEDAKGKSRQTVEKVLRGAKRIVVMRVLSQGRKAKQTFARLDPLWEWLFANRTGLLQADGEGYYDKVKLILKEAST